MLKWSTPRFGTRWYSSEDPDFKERELADKFAERLAKHGLQGAESPEETSQSARFVEMLLSLGVDGKSASGFWPFSSSAVNRQQCVSVSRL